MNITELQSLISKGESDRLEFKQSTGQRREAAKTVCAMLNGLGGFAIFGMIFKGKNIWASEKTLQKYLTISPEILILFTVLWVVERPRTWLRISHPLYLFNGQFRLFSNAISYIYNSINIYPTFLWHRGQWYFCWLDFYLKFYKIFMIASSRC